MTYVLSCCCFGCYFKLWAYYHVETVLGRSIRRQTKATVRDQIGDVHTRLMKKNYAVVPQWWFQVMLVLVLGLSIFTCEGFGQQLQLPYWGVLSAAGLAFFFTLPIGIITATTNQVKADTLTSNKFVFSMIRIVG